ncbi:hypothetical protein OTU49_002700, partial [Cherax quadricarinatus]
MWRAVFLVMVGLAIVAAGPLSRQVGISDNIAVTLRNNTQDCQKDGVVYLTGERVEDPSNPCETCYCSGGEIVCSVIPCVWRDDCEGRHTAGVCCPSYDHCSQ